LPTRKLRIKQQNLRGLRISLGKNLGATRASFKHYRRWVSLYHFG
jgi:hypothetical protein